MSQISIKSLPVTGVIKTIIPEAGDNVNPNGAGEITLTGVNDIAITGNAATQTVDISLSGTTEHAVQVGDATGGIESLAVGTDGQVLLGATAGDPAFATLTSSGGTITFTPGANSLNLEAVAELPVMTDGQLLIGSTGLPPVAASLTSSGGTITITPGAGTINLESVPEAIPDAYSNSFPTDAGTATPALHALTVAGGTNLNSAGAGSTVTLNLDADLIGISSVTTSTGGSLQTGVTAADTLLLRAYDVDGTAYKTFATLTANNTPTMDLDTDVTIGTKYIYRADGTDVPVTDGGTGASTLTDHGVLVGSGTSAVTPLAVGATGEGLMGSTGADPVWTGSPSFSGTVTAGTGIIATTGDVTITAGDLNLPTSSSTAGKITVNGTTVFSRYGGGNLFVGPCGNTTLTTATAINNTIIGGLSLGTSITTANRNTIVGYNAGVSLTEGVSNTLIGGGNSLTTGTYNTFLGTAAGQRIVGGSYNVCIGYGAGSTNTTGSQASNIYLQSTGVVGESNKMRLGNDGTGNGQVDTVYLAGTNANISTADTAGTVNIATGAAAKTVTVGSTNTTSKLDLKFGTSDFSLASATGNVIVAQDTGEVTMPLQPCFMATLNPAVTNVTGDGTDYAVVFNGETWDNNSDFNTTTGVFTAPVTGKYFFNVNLRLNELTSSHTTGWVDFVASSRTKRIYYGNPYVTAVSGTTALIQGNTLLDMTAGDTCYINVRISGGTKVVDVYNDAVYTWFSGHLVC
jgi:hypothetical protein